MPIPEHVVQHLETVIEELCAEYGRPPKSDEVLDRAKAYVIDAYNRKAASHPKLDEATAQADADELFEALKTAYERVGKKHQEHARQLNRFLAHRRAIRN